MAKELLTADELAIEILHPVITQGLIRQVVHRLEDRKTRHQPGRKRWMAGHIRVDRTAARFHKAESIARPSRVSAWFISTIWSSLARKRSFCPLSRRSLGRIRMLP